MNRSVMFSPSVGLPFKKLRRSTQEALARVALHRVAAGRLRTPAGSRRGASGMFEADSGRGSGRRGGARNRAPAGQGGIQRFQLIAPPISATVVDFNFPCTYLWLPLSVSLPPSVSPTPLPLWCRKCEKHVRFLGAWCDRRGTQPPQTVGRCSERRNALTLPAKVSLSKALLERKARCGGKKKKKPRP